MRRKPGRSQRAQKLRIISNDYIRAVEVRVLDEKGEMLGIMTRQSALEKARDAGKDLVLVAPTAKPPVAKIIDSSKYRYQQQQRVAQERKKTKSGEVKELRFTPFMGDGDFESRLKKVIAFLKKGEKVKLTMRFKGREITKKEFGLNLFDRIFAATDEIAGIELEPKFVGKNLMAQLTPKKK